MNELNDLEKKYQKNLNRYYLCHYWGPESNRKGIYECEEKISQLNFAQERVDVDLFHAREDGKNARMLDQSLKSLINQGACDDEIQSWITESAKGNARVADTLMRTKDKQLSYNLQKKNEWRANKHFKITSLPVDLAKGKHPNYLPSLLSSGEWRIVIDETGNEYAKESANKVRSTDLGKLVAVVIPSYADLPPIHGGLHATEGVTLAEIEKVLFNLCSHPVGVFGFTVADETTDGETWYQQVDLLIRWVLRLLPISAGDQTTIRIEVEKRGDYKGDSLAIRGETVLQELKRLSPERFKNVDLRMSFIGKADSEFNGYVDTVANCWSGSSKEKTKLLNHFGFIDNCLLTPQSDGLLERTLLALNERVSANPEDWFALVCSLEYSDSTTLIDEFLEQIGDLARGNPEVWGEYLNALRLGIQAKRNSPAQITRAVNWLERYRPDNLSIPKSMWLQYLSARLDIENHLGTFSEQTLVRVLNTALELKDEDAPTTCEVILRAAISLTNPYDFTSLVGFIDNELEEPPKVYGLRNYGKLLSTRGQLAAFRGEYARAVEYFDKALEAFDRFSDDKIRLRDTVQTRTYRVFASLDDPNCSAAKIEDQIQALLSQLKLVKGDPNLSRLHLFTGDLVWVHHLILRSIVCERVENPRLATEYTAAVADWMSGDSHPWPLIEFYRAILLLKTGNRTESTARAQNALRLCADHPAGVVTWIGLVIQRVTYLLGIISNEQKSLDPLVEIKLKDVLPNAPYEDLKNLTIERMDQVGFDECIKTLLPFNFR